jgi:rhodanese-related sulfurtransferase
VPRSLHYVTLHNSRPCEWLAAADDVPATTVVQAYPEPDTPIVVGCRSGQRSLTAIELLAREGYTNLTNLDGGFLAWAAAARPEA